MANTAKGKVKSTKSAAFAKGGTTKMFSEREAGPQKPGTSTSGGQDAPETQWAKGGSGKMFGKMGANPSKPGVISHSSPGAGSKFASGGSGKMFGYTGSSPAKPR